MRALSRLVSAGLDLWRAFGETPHLSSLRCLSFWILDIGNLKNKNTFQSLLLRCPIDTTALPTFKSSFGVITVNVMNFTFWIYFHHTWSIWFRYIWSHSMDFWLPGFPRSRSEKLYSHRIRSSCSSGDEVWDPGEIPDVLHRGKPWFPSNSLGKPSKTIGEI